MNYALEVEQLTKTYGGSFQALKGINLCVQQGDFFSLLGPNGAGKSTTIGVITSLINKTSGTIRVFGHDLIDDNATTKASIGVVPQEINLAVFEKPMQILINQAGYYGISKKIAKVRAEKYLEQLKLWDKRNEQVIRLSGGMKRRLMIARALICEPKLLILDEPTAGVDIEIRRSMWEFLREVNDQGTTIILTTHYLEEAENLCRHVTLIDRGEVTYHGAMQDFLSTLYVQTFIFDLREPIEKVPTIEGFTCRRLNAKSIEIDVAQTQNLNEIFANLSQQGLTVAGMRNKANRLEELFVKLTVREA